MVRSRARAPFGEEVRRLLAERELPLRRLAARAGIDPGFLVRILQGKEPPSPKVLTGVTRALSLPDDYFWEVGDRRALEVLKRHPGLASQLVEQVAKEHPGKPQSRPRAEDVLTAPNPPDLELARLAAAVLLRYQVDDEFRRAVDEEVPGIKALSR